MTPDELRAYRAQHGWTQASLAQQLGITTTTVARWEQGAAAIPPYLELAIQSVALAQTEAIRRALEHPASRKQLQRR